MHSDSSAMWMFLMVYSAPRRSLESRIPNENRPPKRCYPFQIWKEFTSIRLTFNLHFFFKEKINYLMITVWEEFTGFGIFSQYLFEWITSPLLSCSSIIKKSTPQSGKSSKSKWENSRNTRFPIGGTIFHSHWAWFGYGDGKFGDSANNKNGSFLKNWY